MSPYKDSQKQEWLKEESLSNSTFSFCHNFPLHILLARQQVAMNDAFSRDWFVINVKYTTQNLLRITFSFNDLMLKTNRLKKDFFL